MRGGATIGLVVPTLNEAEAIGPALARVPRDIVDVMLVADGGSRDATHEQARGAGAEVIEVGRGYGRACRMGAEALRQRCSILVFMDGDGADHPESIAALIDPLLAGTQDFVLGARVAGQRAPGSMGLHQVLAGRAFGAALGLLYGVRYTDMGALRAIRTETLFSLGMREDSYGWNLEMQMRAARAGLRILEIAVPYGLRSGGRSKVAGSFAGTLRATSRLGLTFLRIAREPQG